MSSQESISSKKPENSNSQLENTKLSESKITMEDFKKYLICINEEISYSQITSFISNSVELDNIDEILNLLEDLLNKPAPNNLSVIREQQQRYRAMMLRHKIRLMSYKSEAATQGMHELDEILNRTEKALSVTAIIVTLVVSYSFFISNKDNIQNLIKTSPPEEVRK